MYCYSLLVLCNFTSLLIYVSIPEICCLVWYLMLAWNLEIWMRLGHFGLATVDRKVFRQKAVHKQKKI